MRVTESRELLLAVERLVSEFRPRAIYLFGSHASGQAREDSDIDLLVVLEDDSEWLSTLGRRGYGALRPTSLPVELHFRSQESLDRFGSVTGTFEQEVLRTGERLYVAED